MYFNVNDITCTGYTCLMTFQDVMLLALGFFNFCSVYLSLKKLTSASCEGTLQHDLIDTKEASYINLSRTLIATRLY